VRKLVESTFVTLDGVISSPEAWGSPYWDDEHAAYAYRQLFAADALLLGRMTYEAFTQAWPARGGDYADRINELPKYVASTTLREGTWRASILGPDVAGDVAALKRKPGKDVLKFGTGQLDRLLLKHRLVDEYHLWVFPVLSGGGLRLFDGVSTTHLNLVDRTQFASGITVLTLVPR
jgi:dihydrofolate reductase